MRTTHGSDILFVFREVLDGEVGCGFFQRGEDVFWVGDAGVDQAREGVLVAGQAESVSWCFLFDDMCGYLDMASLRRVN